MLVSNPLCENTQMSAVAVPLAGRVTVTGFPPRLQELLAVWKEPSAAIFKSTSLAGCETPAVVGSTTVMSIPVAAGDAVLSAIVATPVPGATTISETLFDFCPFGFCTWTVTLPAACVSLAVTTAVHSFELGHVVVRAVPPISKVDPAPVVVVVNPLPSTRNVNPFASPAYTLAGCNARMSAPVEIVTFATPDCEVSSALIAKIWIASGDGAAPGAVYAPAAVIVPHAPTPAQPLPCTCHVTLWLLVPSTLAANPCTASGASVTFPGCTLTITWLITVICDDACNVASPALVAVTVTGFGEGIAPGAT